MSLEVKAETRVEAAEAAAPSYPVLPRSFVQDKQYETHQALSALHRVTNRWWSNVQGNLPHDPGHMVRTLRATAETLSALADQVEAEIAKARRVRLPASPAGEERLLPTRLGDRSQRPAGGSRSNQLPE